MRLQKELKEFETALAEMRAERRRWKNQKTSLNHSIETSSTSTSTYKDLLAKEQLLRSKISQNHVALIQIVKGTDVSYNSMYCVLSLRMELCSWHWIEFMFSLFHISILKSSLCLFFIGR